MEEKKVLMGGRHFDKTGQGGLTAIREWQMYHSYADTLIAVDSAVDMSGAIDAQDLKTVAVTPWADARIKSGQRWSPALNALLLEAAYANYKYIAYVSTGVRLPKETMESILSFMDGDQDILACGPLSEKHPFFNEGSNPLSGALIPWNNSCVWNVKALAKTGYLTVADGAIELGAQGVEETVVHAVHQRLFSPSRVVLLSGLPGQYVWNQDTGLGQSYLDWTNEKIATKHQRPQRQLELLSPELAENPGVVWHIVWENFLANGFPWN